MSRHTYQHETTTFVYGDDHALGLFLEIRDSRYDHPSDTSEVGLIFEWDELFGIQINKANLTKDEAFHYHVLCQNPTHPLVKSAKDKIDYFIKNIKQKKLYHVHYHWEYSMKIIATFDTMEEAKQKKRELDARHPNPFAKFIIRIETLNPKQHEEN